MSKGRIAFIDYVAYAGTRGLRVGAFGSVGSTGLRQFLITLCAYRDPISPS